MQREDFVEGRGDVDGAQVVVTTGKRMEVLRDLAHVVALAPDDLDGAREDGVELAGALRASAL